VKRVGRDARRSLDLPPGASDEEDCDVPPCSMFGDAMPFSVAVGDASAGKGNSTGEFAVAPGVAGADGGTREDVGVRPGSDAAELARDDFSGGDCTASSPVPCGNNGETARPGVPSGNAGVAIGATASER